MPTDAAEILEPDRLRPPSEPTTDFGLLGICVLATFPLLR